MEHTWNVYHQFNGVGVSKFVTQEVKISEELYQRIQEAIEKEILFQDCGIYREIEKLSEEQLDEAEALEIEKPDEADYDMEDEESQEEYQEALQEYATECDNYIWEASYVEDPTELVLFRKAVLGKYYNVENAKELATQTEDVELCFDSVRSSVTVYLNDYDEVVAVDDPVGEGLEYDDATCSSYEDFYPDYENLAEEIKDSFVVRFEGDGLDDNEEDEETQ